MTSAVHGQFDEGYTEASHPRVHGLTFTGPIASKMNAPRILIILLTCGALSAPFQANARSGSCAAGWPAHSVAFENDILYPDVQSKADPTIHVLINGKVAKMMLDTGAQAHYLWDASLLDEAPSLDSEKTYAHISSADARKVRATLADAKGNRKRQEFLLVSDSILAAYGYAGVLSPQTLAEDSAFIIDLEKNCFFTSAPFEIRSDSDLDVRKGTSIANPYRLMMIPIGLDDREFPMLVDTGASDTSIFAALVEFKPKGQNAPGAIDAFGAEVPKGERMRIVDLKINGETFRARPVIPWPVRKDKQGFENYGFIGMDILKDRVIYYDGARHEFTLLTRRYP